MTAPFQEHTIATRRNACLPTMLGSRRLDARRLTAMTIGTIAIVVVIVLVVLFVLGRVRA